MESASRPVDTRSLISTLGKSTISDQVSRVFKENGLRRPKGEDQEFYQESIAWYPKRSIRVDLYRGKTFAKLANRPVESLDQWYLGGIEFLAIGADDRIKTTFPGNLPCGLDMSASPAAFIQLLGKPHLEEVLVWPGYRGRLLAWRSEATATAVSFESDASVSTVRNYSVNILGCVGAWTDTWPLTFAPNAA